MSYLKSTPIQNDWKSDTYRRGEWKEVLGSITLFHRHCKMYMRRVIAFTKHEDQGIKKLGCTGWFCEVCGIRKLPDVDME